MMDAVERQLVSLKSFDAINDVLNGLVLHPLQAVDVLKMIYSKRAIVRYDTGTGKTFLAAAAMRLLMNEDDSRRFIMFVKKDQGLQTPEKLSKAMQCRVIFSDASAASIGAVLSSGRYLDYHVLMLTHDCLGNTVAMRELFKGKNNFCGVIIDEAHVVNNRGYAMSADMLTGLVSQFEFCWALTATPILTNVLQMAKLASVVDPKRYPNYRKLSNDLSSQRFNIDEDPMFFINRTAEELGRQSEYRGHIVWVDTMPYQRAKPSDGNVMRFFKGQGAVNQAKALTSLVKSMNGKRGLIYIRQHSVRNWVLPFFDEASIRYGCINGNVVAERGEILRKFNTEQSLDVLITSVTTALDADCDYVVFYEFTEEIKQMIGRADRGLDSKVLDVFYLITKEGAEIRWFKENVFDRSDLVRQLLHVDNGELASVCDELATGLERWGSTLTWK